MSFARFADDSDVYVFISSIDHLFECCGCSLGRLVPDLRCSGMNAAEMIEHLRLHQEARDQVPERTMRLLNRSAAA